jgi:hypothetical protein
MSETQKFSEVNIISEQFPSWHPQALAQASQSLGIAMQVIETSELLEGRIRDLTLSLAQKAMHTYGAVGSSTQHLKPALLKNLAPAIALYEILMVDISDSAGDVLGFRRSIQSNIIYSFSTALFNNTPPTVVPSSQDTDFQLLQENILFPLYRMTKEHIDATISKIRSVSVRERLQAICCDITKDYGECVRIMHLSDGMQASQALSFLERNSSISAIPAWLQSADLFYLSKGSPLPVFGLLLEATDNPDITEAQLEALVEFYRDVIPLLHVILDDVMDIAEDALNDDPNFFNLLQEGKLNTFLQLIANEYGLTIYEDREACLLLALDAIVSAKIARIQEALGPSSSKHIQILLDMIHFYAFWAKTIHSPSKEFLSSFETVIFSKTSQ